MTDYEKGYADAWEAIRRAMAGEKPEQGGQDGDSLPMPDTGRDGDGNGEKQEKNTGGSSNDRQDAGEEGRQDGNPDGSGQDTGGKDQQDTGGDNGGGQDTDAENRQDGSGSGQDTGEGEQQASGSGGGHGSGGHGRQTAGTDGGGEDAGCSLTEEEAEALMARMTGTDDFRKAEDRLNELLDMGKGASGQCCRMIDGDRSLEGFVNGENDIYSGKYGQMIITRAKASHGPYKEALTAVRRYIPAMAKALRCRVSDRDWELRGEKSGRLDTGKLAACACGSEGIFTRRGTTATDGIALCILIDESGSMSGERVTAAREAAVLISEAVHRLPKIRCFIYGFTSDLLSIYEEDSRGVREALGSTGARSGTPTHTAMHVAQQRIRRMTRSRCLMAVITDGCPNKKDRTVAKIAELERDGFTVVGVDICNGHAVAGIFRDSVVTDGVAELAPRLARIIRKKMEGVLDTRDVCE